MKLYYYLVGNQQNGPWTIEQLSYKGLTDETLIWTEGMENWQKLKDIPELYKVLKPKIVPPPPPNQLNEKVEKNQISTFNFNKKFSKGLNWLVVWFLFNLFALITSYSQIKIFNDGGKPLTNRFWPFVKFTYKYCYSNGQKMYFYEGSGGNTGFYGLFVDYDWSEFTLYVIGAILIFIIIKSINRK